MRRTLGGPVVVVAVTLGVATAFFGGIASRARAQDRDARVAPSSESGSTRTPTRDELERAAVLFERSALAYAEERYDVAIALLTEAYALSREPILVYNLARAREGAGEVEPALETYRRYLELAPDAENAALVRERIAGLEQTLEERDVALEIAREREAERERLAREEAERTASEAREREEARRRAREEARRRAAEPSPWPWVVAGGGAAGLVVGTVLGAVAVARNDDAIAAETQVDARALASEAQSLAVGASVALVAGGVLLGVGATWGVIDLTDEPRDESALDVQLSIGPGSLELRGAF